MTDEIEKPQDQEPIAPPPTAESKNTEPAEHMIPKSRFDEVLKEKEKVAKALAKFQQDEEARKLAELSEIDKVKKLLEKADAERQRVELELKTERERNMILGEAGKLGFINPEQAYRLLDRDDEGNIPSGALAKLAKESPYLLKQESTPGTPKPGAKPTKEAQKPVYPPSRY